MEESKDQGNENGEQNAPTLEEAVKAREAAEKELADTRKELEGYKSKDYNFKRLRDMTDVETSKLSDMEKDLIRRQEHLEEEQRTWSQKVVDGHKNDALNVLAGEDVELRKKVQFHYDRIKDDATTRDEVSSKMREAYILATGGSYQGVDQINRAAAFSSTYPMKQQKKGEFTAEQKALAAKMGVTDEELKKFSA